MPLVTTAELVRQAASRGGGVAAFNVITLEHAEGIAAGAQRSGRPFGEQGGATIWHLCLYAA